MVEAEFGVLNYVNYANLGFGLIMGGEWVHSPRQLQSAL